MAEHLKLEGEWENISETGLDDLLQKLGISFMKRKLALTVRPTQKISFDGNKMKLITESKVKSGEKIIPLDGSEISDEMFDNKAVVSATVNEDGSISVKGKVSNMDMTTVRKIDKEGQMVLTTTIGGVECVRVFTRK